MPKLVIGNKNYSSWSMRPWVLMREFDLPFEEVKLRFDDMGPDSAFRRALRPYTPAGRVPVLVLDDGQAVWDTLAIAETLAERHPQLALWPQDAARRARARAVVCEMHAGFGAMRGAFGFNAEADLADIGARLLAERADVRADVERVQAIWRDALAASGGPFLFGGYSIADAFYAPVAGRFRTYAVPLEGDLRGYVERLMASRGVAQWYADALDERDFVAFDEPYRTSR